VGPGKEDVVFESTLFTGKLETSGTICQHYRGSVCHGLRPPDRSDGCEEMGLAPSCRAYFPTLVDGCEVPVPISSASPMTEIDL